MKLTINIPDDVTLLRKKVEAYEEYLDEILFVVRGCNDRGGIGASDFSEIEDIITNYNDNKDLEDE